MGELGPSSRPITRGGLPDDPTDNNDSILRLGHLPNLCSAQFLKYRDGLIN